MDDARLRLAPVFQQYNVTQAIVFGSVARGEPSPQSDLDLILVMETDRRFLDRYEGIFQELFEAMEGPSVDALIYTPAELDRMRGRRFIAQALAEGKVIYESE